MRFTGLKKTGFIALQWNNLINKPYKPYNART